MLGEANNFLAIHHVRLKSLAMNQSIISFLGSDAAYFCQRVQQEGLDEDSPLNAGLPYCRDITSVAPTVHGDNIIVGRKAFDNLR